MSRDRKAMLRQNTAHLDYGALMKASRRLDRAGGTRRVRVALLADATVTQLEPLLRVLFAHHGVDAEIYVGEYDAIAVEVLDDASGLYAFKPDVIAILNSTDALCLKYYGAGEDRSRFADEVVGRMVGWWDAIERHTPALILHGNFVAPLERQFGNYDHKIGDALSTVVASVNIRLSELARGRAQVRITDIEALASYIGRKHFCDARLWIRSKAFCDLRYLPHVAQNLADMVLASLGTAAKCVVLDLDNTLWGGVIGDDGLEGIEIGPYGDGEPYHRLQFFLRELKRRGIILAVCSKNERETALAPFRSHPEMVLRENDISVFVANWEPKPDNLRRIREQLNIGFDAMVFLDDNPFERDLVRTEIPEIIVPDLPDEPSDYLPTIAALNLFEVASFSDEDRRRGEQYRLNAERDALAAQSTDLPTYLRSLDMRVVFERFDEFHLGRIVQLLQRSNQFNLTTQRYGEPECRALMADPTTWPWYVKLTDRFGDNGLISVVIVKRGVDALVIDSWLMSCRVLGRGVEGYAMNRVVELTRAEGLGAVVGHYRPTAKNAMVREFFGRFGFVPSPPDGEGNVEWRLDVAQYAAQEEFMVAERSQEGNG